VKKAGEEGRIFEKRKKSRYEPRREMGLGLHFAFCSRKDKKKEFAGVKRQCNFIIPS
jgi:hypothetical protein